MSSSAAAGATIDYNAHVDGALTKLASIYRKSIQPMEDSCEYSVFKGNGWFADGIKQKQPFALFIGPYSAGKSTFINYLLQGNYLATGPQPVTDKFGVILHGDEHQVIPGRVLVADSGLPFRALEEHGSVFVDALEGVQVPHELLRSVTLIDSPGVLESTSTFHNRRYDYTRAMRWFVERSDVVYFVFDPTKLDAGQELRLLFKHGIKGFEGRVRIVLNKADTLGPQGLMRVYGALFWNLSTLLATTEPPRVYVSSFWDRPYRLGTDHALFDNEKADLICELVDAVPRMGLDNRVAAVIRHANAVMSHALICGTVRGRLPSCCGQDTALRESIDHLPALLTQVAAKWRLPAADLSSQREEYKKFFTHPGVEVEDMPDVAALTKRGSIDACRRAIDTDLPALLRPIRSGPVPDPHERRRVLMSQRGGGSGYGSVTGMADKQLQSFNSHTAAAAAGAVTQSSSFDVAHPLLTSAIATHGTSGNAGAIGAIVGVPVTHPLVADPATTNNLQLLLALRQGQLNQQMPPYR